MNYANPTHRKKKKMFLGGALDFIGDNAGAIGAGLGAGVGSIVPGVGTALGAQLGGMAGGLAQNALADEPKNEQGGRAVQGLNTPVGSTGGSYGYSTYAARGGMVRGVNPKNGAMKSIGQDASEFVGPSHSRGGIDIGNNTEVEGGETMDFVMDNGTVKRKGQKKAYVFSDRVKVPNSNMTFADYHKNLVSRGAADDEITRLAQQQEQVTGRNSNPNNSNRMMKGGGYAKRMAYGGYPNKKKMLGGGWLENNQNQNNASQPMNTMSTQDIPVNLGPMSARTNTLDMEDQTSLPSGQGPSFGQNLGGLAKAAAPYAGDLLNIGRGLFEDVDVESAPSTRMSDRGVNLASRMRTDINTNPQRAAISSNLRSITSNPNASMNERLAAYSGALRARNQLEAQTANAEAELENQRLSSMMSAAQNADQVNARMRFRGAMQRRDDLMRARAAKSNMLTRGVAGLSRTYQQQQAMDNMRERDAMGMAAVMAGMSKPVRENFMKDIRSIMQKYRS